MRTVLWRIALVCAFGFSGCAATTPRQTLSCALQPADEQSDGMRGRRYCEILFFQGAGNNTTGCVYTTISLNDCPQEQWEALNARDLKREYQVSNVIMNGPRYFMMDIFSVTTTSQGVSIDGLEMRPGASIEMPPGSLVGSFLQQPYSETPVVRDTKFVYLAGQPTYRLVSPDHTYILQSYSLIVDPTLTQTDLVALGDKLKLPKGWSYVVTTPTADLIVKSNGKAYVIQDSLQDTYQRMD